MSARAALPTHVPGETVADCKAAQEIIRSKCANHAEGEQGQRHTKGEERLVVNELLLLGKTQDLASDEANERSNDDTEHNLE